MDPNVNLEEQRQIIATLLGGEGAGDADNLGMRLAELAQALDGWLSKGGFLPRAWGKREGPES